MKEGLRRARGGDPREVGAWAIETIYRLFATEDHSEGVRQLPGEAPAGVRGALVGAASGALRPRHRRRRHRRLGAGDRDGARRQAGAAAGALRGVRGPGARRVDRALGRRRDAAARPLRPAAGGRRPPPDAPRHLRRVARPGRGRGRDPAARHLQGGRAGAAVHRPSEALPDPVRRGGARRRRGAARRQRHRDRGRRGAERHLRARRRDDHRRARGSWSAPTGARRRCARPPASCCTRTRRTTGSPACWSRAPTAGATIWRRSAPRATSPSWRSRKAAGGCASTAAMRLAQTGRFKGPDGAAPLPRHVPDALRARTTPRWRPAALPGRCSATSTTTAGPTSRSRPAWCWSATRLAGTTRSSASGSRSPTATCGSSATCCSARTTGPRRPSHRTPRSGASACAACASPPRCRPPSTWSSARPPRRAAPACTSARWPIRALRMHALAVMAGPEVRARGDVHRGPPRPRARHRRREIGLRSAAARTPPTPPRWRAARPR